MKIVSLVENTSKTGMKTAHGLSLYIETGAHKLLFDLGPDETLFINAKEKGIDLKNVDTVVISHGHHDHGGALKQFLQVNDTARVYIHHRAFEPHFRKDPEGTLSYIGLDPTLKEDPRVILTGDAYDIAEGLSLFACTSGDKCISTANNTLYDENGPDKFPHEQSLLIRERKAPAGEGCISAGKVAGQSGENGGPADGDPDPVEICVLVMGCGHRGVVNILEGTNAKKIDLCIGGFHLNNPKTGKCVSPELLEEIAAELGKNYPDTAFYTCHCTGKEAFEALEQRMPNMHYLSCGDEIEV